MSNTWGGGRPLGLFLILTVALSACSGTPNGAVPVAVQKLTRSIQVPNTVQPQDATATGGLADGVVDFGQGYYSGTASNDPDLALPSSLPDGRPIGGPAGGGGPPIPEPSPLVAPHRSAVTPDATTIVYSSCTQVYQEKTLGVEDPSVDMKIGDEVCISFNATLGDVNFIGTTGGGLNGVGVGGKNLLQPPCTTTTTGMDEPIPMYKTVTYGCSHTVRCRSDYYQANQLAPQELAAFEVENLQQYQDLGALMTFIGTLGTGAIGAWAARIGAGAFLFATVQGQASNMTPSQANQIMSEWQTLNNDMLANGCETVVIGND